MSAPKSYRELAFEGSPERRIAARIADLWWLRDRLRAAQLDRLIATTTRCRFCGRYLSERAQDRLAGVCTQGGCKGRDAREKAERLAEPVEAA